MNPLHDRPTRMTGPTPCVRPRRPDAVRSLCMRRGMGVGGAWQGDGPRVWASPRPHDINTRLPIGRFDYGSLQVVPVTRSSACSNMTQRRRYRTRDGAVGTLNHWVLRVYLGTNTLHPGHLAMPPELTLTNGARNWCPRMRLPGLSTYQFSHTCEPWAYND